MNYGIHLIGGFSNTSVAHTNLSDEAKRYIVDNLEPAMQSPDGDYLQFDAETLRGLTYKSDIPFSSTDKEIIVHLHKHYHYLEISTTSELAA